MTGSRSLAERARPIKRVEYERMVAAGLFEGERIELWKGVLLPMAPQYSPHASTVQALMNVLLVPTKRATVRVQLPIALSEDSEPEPDVAVVAWNDYYDTHPSSAHLIIEVAQSSLTDDRTFKAAEYARAGIPEYWIVNVRERTIEVHRDPRPEGYRVVFSVERVSPLAFPDLVVDVTDVIRASGEH